MRRVATALKIEACFNAAEGVLLDVSTAPEYLIEFLLISNNQCTTTTPTLFSLSFEDLENLWKCSVKA